MDWMSIADYQLTVKSLGVSGCSVAQSLNCFGRSKSKRRYSKIHNG